MNEPEGLSELVERVCKAPTSVNMKQEIIRWLEVQLARAKEQERKRLIGRLESWRLLGIHLISDEAILALKEGKW